MLKDKTCSRCGKRVWLLNSGGKTVLIEPYEIYIVPNRYLKHRYINAGGKRTGGREVYKGDANAVTAYREHYLLCNGDNTVRPKATAAKKPGKKPSYVPAEKKLREEQEPKIVQTALFDYNDLSVRCICVN